MRFRMDYEEIIKQFTPNQVKLLFEGEYPKKHTLETLIKVLELEHPDVFEKLCKDKDYYPRQSGRTTRMLLNACLAVQNEPVLVLGHNAFFTKVLQQDLMKMCIKAGISNTQNIVKRYVPMSLLLSHALKSDPLRDSHNLKVFVDHYRAETSRL